MTPDNRDKPPITLRFFDTMPTLRGHKSQCPVCQDGILLMCRDIETGQLLAEDSCCVCGQRVVYKDIEQVRKVLP